MRHFFLLFLFACALTARAQDASTAVKLESSLCDWPHVYMNVDWEMWNAKGVQANSDRVHKLSKEIKKMAETVTDQNKSVISQLSSSDQAIFKIKTTEFNLLTAYTNIQNKNIRQLAILDHFIRIIDIKYRWYDTVYSENDPDKIYRDFAEVLPILNNGGNVEISSPSNSTICSIEGVIYKLEVEASNQMTKIDNSENFTQAVQTVNALQNKYSIKPIDRNKLSKSDQAIFDDINARVLQPVDRYQKYINQLEGMKLLVRAMDLSYQMSLNDLKDGDYTKLGNTLKVMLDIKRFNEQEVNSLGFWEAILSKIKTNWPPADSVYIN